MLKTIKRVSQYSVSTCSRWRTAAIVTLLVSGALPVCAQTYTIAPSPKFLGLDANAHPLSSGKLCTYLSGTTTPATTYSSSSGTANANPVILDSAGRADVWLAPGQSYTFVLRSAGSSTAECTTGTIQWSKDGISGVPTTSGNADVLGTAGEALTAGQVAYLSDGSGSKTAGAWYRADSTNTYSSIFPIVGMVPTSITSGSVGTIRLAGQATGLSSLSVGNTYYISATPGTLSNTAPANRRIVGVADSTSSLVVFPALPSSAITSTITTTGSSVALAIPAGDGPLTIFANNATLHTIQGIAAGRDGQELTIASIGAGQVDLSNQDGAAAAALRVITGVTGTISLSAGSGRAVLRYDATTARWRVVFHEQGAWITPAFTAGNFTGTTQPWTVGAGDVTTSSYYLKGRQLSYRFYLSTTTVTAGATALNISNAQWGSFTANLTTLNPMIYNDNGGGNTVGFVSVQPAATAIVIQKLTGTFGAATDTTGLFGEITFEIQ